MLFLLTNLDIMALQFNCALAADVVLFGFMPEEKLAVILIQRKNSPFKDKWALPGGFINEDERVTDAAKREMLEETGVSLQRLSQVGVYGKPDRDPRGRVVSVSYFGIIQRSGLKLKAGDDAKQAKWFEIDQLPPLAFDHAEIIKNALFKLKRKLGTNRGGIPLNGVDTNSEFADKLQMMF